MGESPPPPEATVEANTPQLGVDRDAIKTHRLDQLGDLSAQLAGQARRSLEIVSRDLDPRVYDQAPFLVAIRRLATSARQARIRVLVREVEPAVKPDHRLIELARRLSSFIEIRRLGDDDREFNEAFLLVDQIGFLRRPTGDGFEAEGSFHDPLRTRELLRAFDDLWSRARADANLRRLHI